MADNHEDGYWPSQRPSATVKQEQQQQHPMGRPSAATAAPTPTGVAARPSASSPTTNTATMPAAASSLVTKPRLVIKNIEVNNFKSYAGEHTIGPFHKTFTAVIGPNGSGKSNVIDAMLFVFGKNAKKIRLEKLSELIHVSAAYPDLMSASVTVNFVQVRESEEDKKDPTQRLEVPNSQLSVKREVFKSNSSQYYINGHKRTQREVVETLTGHGIDLDHNRFLILQGEVQQIALMKPKAEKEGEEGLVEYFDDLIGSNQFLPSIKEATRIVEESQESRLTSLDVLRKVQGERDALSSAKDSTLSFIRKDNHLQRMVTVLCQLKLAAIEEKLIEPRRKVQELEAAIAHLEKKQAERQAEFDDLHEEDGKMKRQLNELRAECDTLKKDKSKMEVEAEKLKTSNDEFEKLKKRETDKLKRLKEDVQKMDMDINNCENDLGIQERNLTEASDNVTKQQAEYDTKANEVQSLQRPIRQKLEGLRKELTPFDIKCVKADQAVKDARYKLDTVVMEEQAAGEELARMSEERQTKLAILQQDEDKIQRAEAGTPELDAQITVLEERRMQATKLKYHLNSQIDNAKREFTAAESGDNVSRVLASRSLPKYYGSLRQLGRIADEYDVAAGVASGMWDYHVVEDNETAVQVVDILKREGLRCTMMVLEKITAINGAEMEKDFKAPPNSQRIFDLIQPVKPKFRIAFYNAVRNTLVARDLETARKVAYDGHVRNRVATLRGELLERNGGFSGGGMTPPGARLKASHAAPDKEATKQKMIAWQAELVKAVEEERQVMQELQVLAAQRTDISPEEVRRTRTNIAGLKSSINSLNGKIEQGKERLKEAQQEARKRDALEDKHAAAKAAHEAAVNERRALAGRVEVAEAELRDVAGPEFRALLDNLTANKAAVEKAEQAIKDHKRTSQRLKVAKESRMKEVEKVTAAIERLQNEAREADKVRTQQLAASIEELATKIRRLMSEISALEGKNAELNNTMGELTRKITHISGEVSTRVNERNEEVSKMREEQAQIERIEQRIEDTRLHVLAYVQEFGVATLRTHDVESSTRSGRGRKRDRTLVAQEAEEGANEDGDEEDSQGGPSSSSQPQYDEDEEDEEPDDDEAFDADNFSLRVTPEQLKTYDEARVGMMAKELQGECGRLKGQINFEAVGIWRRKQAEYKEKKADYEAVLAALTKAEAELDDLTDRRRDLFMDNFKIIQRKLKEMYQLLAQGGDADVDLINATDPYEGIAFTVRPPKKSWKQVGNLSGGEQTLSSLALVFALHHIKPTPIYVMDEIDAALDFRNVSIVGRYVLEQAQGAQFIIISLRNNMFELAHQLVGICKVNDVTRSLTINPSEVSLRIQRQLERLQAAQNGARRAQPLLEHKRNHAALTGPSSTENNQQNDENADPNATRGRRTEQ